MRMGTSGGIFRLALVIFLAGCLIAPSESQTCSQRLTISNTPRVYTQCQSLTQGSSIAWTFHPNNSTLDVAVSGTLSSSSGWLAWGYNPTRPAMNGTSALIAYTNASGPQLNLYSVLEANKGGASAPLVPVAATRDVRVLSKSIQISQASVQFAALLQLSSNESQIFHIWNRGNAMTGDSPQAHPLDAEHTTSGGRLSLESRGGSQTCSQRLTISNIPRVYTQCQSLTQGTSIAWTFHPNNSTLDVAVSGTLSSSSGWLAWGYNPTRPAMDGTSALIAYTNASGAQLNLYSVLEANKGGASAPLVPTDATRDVRVLSKSVQISQNSVQFAALLQLSSNESQIFHIWNRGNAMTGDSPQSHPLDVEHQTSAGRLNLESGAVSQAAVPRLRLKNAHGIVNAVGWGILLPIGAMSARYLRPFEWADPAWFYLHVLCQTAGYILGVVGWATGLRLGSDSVGIKFSAHRNIGITMFVFGTLQVLAIVLRPNKKHEYRIFWNVYHHILGYTTIVLAVVNIFKGLDILEPGKGWKNAYIGIIVGLGVLSLLLEAVTWVAWFQRRGKSEKRKAGSGNPYGDERHMSV